MAFTPFDFNEAIHQRREHAEEGLRYGSPVIAVSCQEALAVLTVRRTQRKVFEIYDRLIYSAIGNQSDIEAVRLAAVDLAAREGYERSPDDVTVQRLVGFALSTALKEVFRDQFRAPSVIRALFGELGDTPDRDVFYVLNYDGEFSAHSGVAVVAGTRRAEEAVRDALEALGAAPRIADALPKALEAWALGYIVQAERDRDEGETSAADTSSARLAQTLREELAHARVEVGILDRLSTREARFRLYAASETEPLVAPYTSSPPATP